MMKLSICHRSDTPLGFIQYDRIAVLFRAGASFTSRHDLPNLKCVIYQINANRVLHWGFKGSEELREIKSKGGCPSVLHPSHASHSLVTRHIAHCAPCAIASANRYNGTIEHGDSAPRSVIGAAPGRVK